MTDQEISLNAGFDRNWLAELKWRNPTKYKIMRRMGVTQYINYDARLRAQLGIIYWEIKESNDMTMSEFWSLYLRPVITSKHAFMVYIKSMAFTLSEATTRLSAVKRMQYIVKAYDKYKQRKQYEKTIKMDALVK